MIDCAVDSTALVDLLRENHALEPILARFSEIAVPHVALGELLLGALKSKNPSELRRTLFLVKGMTILSGDSDTAGKYAQIRHGLESGGTPIPQNDIWIAASAIQAGVPLITRDRHFRRVPGLTVLEY
jgi:predicted nucleic acid-binding protein